MSWGGPAVGAAPYQPPPFSNGQPNYPQQQPYQYGQQPAYSQYQGAPSYPPAGPPQRPPDNRPPKKKGNPIITRYPPPPGYRGPAQAQGPFGSSQYQNQYPPSQQGYTPGYSAPSNYPTSGYPPPPPPPNYPPTPAYSPQSYGPPQNYPQASQTYPPQVYPQSQNYQYPQQSYPPQYPQTPNYQDAQAPPQPTTYQSYPPQPAPTDPSQQTYAPQQSWQPPNAQPVYPPNAVYNQYSGPPPVHPIHAQDPNATPTPTSAYPASGAPNSATTEQGEGAELNLKQYDWDFDFDGAIWPKTNEPVDPNLSLGVIIWRPAKQVTRALPCTFDEAEEQALKPPAEKLGNGESVSIYFTLENSHEAFLDVRQTDEWYRIRKDPVFVVFPNDKDMDLIPLEECIAKRDRPDELLEDLEDDEEIQDSSWNVMDNLEQALSGQDENTEPRSQARIQDTSSSRDQQQEDILAMLGVTGSPKPPSGESIPFPHPTPADEKPSISLPEKPPIPPVSQIPHRPEHPSQPQRSHSYTGHRNSSHPPPPPRPYGSLSVSTQNRPPPPPPPPPNQQEYDPWNPKPLTTNNHAYDGLRASPTRSEGSNNTLAGSDFDDKPANDADQTQDSESTQVSTLHRSDSSFSRKRSYEDTDQADDKSRQQDDHTKRKRRSQVDPIYSRR